MKKEDVFSEYKQKLAKLIEDFNDFTLEIVEITHFDLIFLSLLKQGKRVTSENIALFINESGIDKYKQYPTRSRQSIATASRRLRNAGLIAPFGEYRLTEAGIQLIERYDDPPQWPMRIVLRRGEVIEEKRL